MRGFCSLLSVRHLTIEDHHTPEIGTAGEDWRWLVLVLKQKRKRIAPEGYAEPPQMGIMAKTAKRRLDSLLVAKGLVESKAKAQALIMAGVVEMKERAVTKPGMLVDEKADISLREGLPFVSRGGIKLDYALEQFDIDVSSEIALDVGASTGGFTDCLLKRGASRVYAVDVGYGLLDYRLRQNPRVIVMERVNAHYPFTLPEKVGLAVLDLSFISVTKVIPNVVPLLREGSSIVVLFKPQFEARRNEVGKGGLIKSPLVHAQVLARFVAWAVEQRWRLGGLVPSPIRGASGNKEFLALLRYGKKTGLS